MDLIRDQEQLALAVAELVVIEPRFKTIVDCHGLPPLRWLPEGFATLFRIVTDQLISLSAAESIWNRIVGGIEPLTAHRVAEMTEGELRLLGLSGPKARTFLAVSNADIAGHFERQRLQVLDDDDARTHLMQIYGIGPWTAEIYMLSALGRADAWPAGDIALQTASAHLFDLKERPNARAMEQLAASWRPLRSVAARLLWCHYRTIKGMAPGK
jgi:DNA-3-methyladenine glycosylase II